MPMKALLLSLVALGGGFAGLSARADGESTAAARARQAIRLGTDVSLGRFRLAHRGETYGAAWEPGADGSPTNGVLAFSDGSRTLTLRGFDCALAGAGAKPHVAFSVTGGTLSMKWSMPGVARSMRGEPRYARLRPGTWSERPVRVYAGMGNVIDRPTKFTLRAGGFTLSTRHVGADFAGGLSVVVATDVFPRELVCDAASGVFGPAACEDATFRFTPSAKGAFDAARRFADVSGYRKSAGFDRLCGRTVLDQWGGDYAEAASGLERAAVFGVTNAVFVKHVWQRHGYDVQLPDVYPPAGDLLAFKAMVAAAQRHGTDFCPHDNYIDFYSNATGFAACHLMHDAAGRPVRAWFNRSVGVQSWKWLPGACLPWLERNMKLMREGFGPDGLFIDVFTAAAPPSGYDVGGRYFTADETARAWGEIFDRARRLLGRPHGPMLSEAGTDILIGCVDACEADHYSVRQWRIGRETYGDSVRVPWHDMVTHGRMILAGGGLGHRYADGGDARVYGYASDDYLATTAIGGRNPMCEGPFGRGAVMTDWLLHDVLEPLARGTFESFVFDGGNIRRQHATFSGGEVFVNRATNDDWRVARRILPRDGFLIRSSAGEAGVVRLAGRRAAYSRTKERLFVDARTPYYPDGRDYGRLTVGAAERTARGKWRIAVSTALTDMPTDAIPFVHVVPCGKESPILRQGRYVADKDGFVEVDDPGTNSCDVLVGFYRRGGRRFPLRNAEDLTLSNRQGRMCVGTIGPEGWTRPPRNDPPPEAEMNAAGTLVDFAAVRTDGAFRLIHPAEGDWELLPLPGSRPFSAAIRLEALGVGNRRVMSVEGALSWSVRDGVLTLSVDGGSERHRIRLSP